MQAPMGSAGTSGWTRRVRIGTPLNGEARGPGVAAESAAWEWDPFVVPVLQQHGEKLLTPAVSVGLLPNKPTECSPFQLLPLRICSRRVVGKSTQRNRDISCQRHEQEANRALDPDRVGVPLHLLTLEAKHACSTRTRGQCVCSLRAGGVRSTSADIQTPMGAMW